jgi:hypothetical protein
MKALIFVALVLALGWMIQFSCGFAAPIGVQEWVRVDVPKAYQYEPFNSRFLYSQEQVKKTRQEIVVPDLPDRSIPHLGGIYGHELKNIAIGPDRKLYIDIASSTNADPTGAAFRPPHSHVLTKEFRRTRLP